MAPGQFRPVKRQVLAVLFLCQLTLQGSSTSSDCERKYFGGFDSRLRIETVAVLPSDTGEPVDFQVSGGFPYVAFAHRVLRLSPKEIAAIPSLDSIQALLMTRAGEVRISTSTGLKAVGDTGFVPDRVLATRRRFYDDGNPMLLQVVDSEYRSSISVLKTSGQEMKVIDSAAKVSAVGWNAVGLSMVSGDVLFAWREGATKFEPVAMDVGLANARGSCLVGSNRVVVALPRAIVLLTPETRIVIAAVRSLVRFEDGVLYVLDLERAKVFAVRGLDQIGNVKADESHVQQLLAQPTDLHILEAARIVGCKEVRRRLSP